MSLKDRLKARIRSFGPITVADYMTACLHDPSGGYYAVRPALGPDGDFITAPLISQMFGELLGLWAVETWRGLGRPARVLLVEAGPGDGTLICDALRAARVAPDFLAAASLRLIDTSQPLIAMQHARLTDAALEARWASSLADLPDDLPMILIANELLDCLPARQVVRTPDGWAERRVGLDDGGELMFGLAPCPDDLTPGHAVAVGAVIEVSAAQAALGGAIGARVTQSGGAALLIDYGRDRFDVGDTLQALRRHQKVDPLAEPGAADLTVHADFPAVLAAAAAEGARGAIISQGAFLRRLGIQTRAEAIARARPDQAPAIARQLARLTDPSQMGDLFKAACLYAPGKPPPPGFEGPR